ncbi:MAG: single-stranded DNA-binding protein [Candidatus Margulisiibacteriota bacterium]
MPGLNRAILCGRLVADPVVRYTQNENAVAHFRLAVNWRGRGGSGTEFINCVAWNGLAKICGEYLKKGKMVAVEGRLQIRSFKNKNGQSKSAAEVILDTVQMLDTRFYQAASKHEKPQEELLEV